MVRSTTKLADLVPKLLEQTLDTIANVRLYSVEHSVRHNPPLGSVGGAGKAAPITIFILNLRGTPENTTRLLERVAQECSSALSFEVQFPGDAEPRQTIRWEISRYQPRHLVLTFPGNLTQTPLSLGAQVPSSHREFSWRIIQTS